MVWGPWWLYFISVFNFQFLFCLSLSLPLSFFRIVFLSLLLLLLYVPLSFCCDAVNAVPCHGVVSSTQRKHITQALDDYEIEEDLPNAMKLLGEMNNNVKQVSDLVESMLQRVKSGELTTEYGLSFLEVRYHMLLTYLINLTYVVLRKCSGTIFNISNRLK